MISGIKFQVRYFLFCCYLPASFPDIIIIIIIIIKACYF